MRYFYWPSQSFAHEETVSAEVRNMIGQRLYSTVAHFRDGKALVDAGELLVPGIYYLSLKDAVDNVYTMRFVKE